MNKSPPAEQGLQVWHFSAREGIFLGVVVAESDAIEEEEEGFQMRNESIDALGVLFFTFYFSLFTRYFLIKEPR